MELLRTFVEGDMAVFETIFREAEPDIYRWLLRMVRDPAIAEDLVIETRPLPGPLPQPRARGPRP